MEEKPKEKKRKENEEISKLKEIHLTRGV